MRFHCYIAGVFEDAPVGRFDPRYRCQTKPAIFEIVAMDATGAPKTLGTGFFVSPDDLAVTNQHVVEGATSISAVNNNGAIFLFE
jgi:S1-C subfamily serine protease